MSTLQNCNIVSNLSLSLQDPNDPEESCPRTRRDIIQYQISFQTGSVVTTENVNITAVPWMLVKTLPCMIYFAIAQQLI